MKKLSETIVIKFIAYSPIIFIPTIVIVFILMISKINSDDYKSNISELYKSIKQEKELSIKSKVDGIANFIEYKKSITKEQLKNRVQNRVQNAKKIALGIYDKYKNKKSNEEIKEIIITALRTLTWNDGNSFIWILDYDGVSHLQPKYLRHLEGTSILNIKDASGKYIIKEEIKLCKNKQGFLWDTFTKPNGKRNRQYKQLAFVEDFGHFNWYLGSSEHLDTAEAIVNNNLIKSMKSLSKIDDNYLIVFKKTGQILLHLDEKYVGTNLQDSNKKSYDNMMKKFKNKQSIDMSYQWKHKKTGKPDTKYTYMRKVKNHDCIVASGYYKTDLLTAIQTKNDTLKKDYNTNLIYILIGSIFVMLVSLFVSSYLAKQLKIIYTGYKDSLSRSNKYMLELEILANTDNLTQINNRHSILNHLDNEIKKYKRFKTPFCLAMFDIDYFKSVNDNYGHDIGDNVLKEMASLVTNSLRDIDMIGRYGGEEFLILLPNTSLSSAKDVILRVHKEIETHVFKEVGQVTVSMGLIEVHQEEEFDEVFRRVDDFLYTAKDSGRNKVVHEKEEL